MGPWVKPGPLSRHVQGACSRLGYSLIAEDRLAAHSEAPQRQQDAHHWGRVALAVARLTGKRVGLDTATRMATDANFRGNRERLSSVAREPLPDIDPIEELRRTLEEDE
jgi:hypothetical protein